MGCGPHESVLDGLSLQALQRWEEAILFSEDPAARAVIYEQMAQAACVWGQQRHIGKS